MRYVSTRGGISPRSFGAILLEGLAPDGGLVVPEAYPPIPLVTSHSRDSAAARLPQTSRPN